MVHVAHVVLGAGELGFARRVRGRPERAALLVEIEGALRPDR
ncbi:hypothetical protein [Streptomyces sp. NPDC056323]